MLNRCFLLVALLSLASIRPLFTPTPPIKAQDERPWEIVFLARDDDALYVINEEGLVETIHSEALSHISDEAVYSLALSPNREYLAYSAQNTSIDIVNLKTNESISISAPFILTDVETLDFSMGDFNADSTQFAFGFRLEDPTTKFGVVGGVATYNLLTGDSQHHLFVTDFNPIVPLGVSWDGADVLMLLSSSWEPTYSGPYQRWTPGTDTYTETDRFTWAGHSATLPLTGEVGVSMADSAYPSSGESGYEGPYSNVLRYFVDGADFRLRDENPPVYIYTDTSDHITNRPIWVMDGAGILHQDNDTNYHLILRDGTQVALTIESPIIWGTTTGWLVQEGNSFVHYRYENSEISGTIIWEYTGDLRTLGGTSLGEASTGTFATIPPL